MIQEGWACSAALSSLPSDRMPEAACPSRVPRVCATAPLPCPACPPCASRHCQLVRRLFPIPFPNPLHTRNRDPSIKERTRKARRAPRDTARQCTSISSMVMGSVVSWPAQSTAQHGMTWHSMARLLQVCSMGCRWATHQDYTPQHCGWWMCSRGPGGLLRKPSDAEQNVGAGNAHRAPPSPPSLPPAACRCPPRPPAKN